MYDLPTTFRQATSSAPASDYGLPPDLLARARTRIAGLAGVLGALSLIEMILNATVFRGEVDSAVQPQHLLAVGLTLVVIVSARSKRIAATTALSIGLVYEVCVCWIISFAAQRAAIELVGRAPEVTWTSMIIVVFPIVIPLPPSRLLVASILAAISAPVSLLLLDQMGTTVAAGDLQELLDEGDTLLLLIQQHNQKEEQMLYPMSEQALSSSWPELHDRLEAHRSAG